MELTFRKRGKYWQYSFEVARIDGKRKRVYKSGFRTKGEAAKAGTEALNEYMNSGIAFRPTDSSVADFLEEWLDNVSKTKRLNTFLNYKLLCDNHIIPNFGKYKMNAISTLSLQTFFNQNANNLSLATLKSIKRILSVAFNWAIDMDYIKSNPINRVKLPIIKETESLYKHIYISPEEFKKIVDMFKNTAYIVPYMIAYHTGMRVGEVLGLQWKNIDFEKHEIYVCSNFQRYYLKGFNDSATLSAPKTSSSERTIVISDFLNDFLKERYCEIQKNKGKYQNFYTHYYLDGEKHIVTNNNGGLDEIDLVCVRDDGSYISRSSLKDTYKKVRDTLKIKNFDFHSLRKTHCTELISRGANIKDVQKRLGHKDIAMTLRVYTEVTAEMTSKTKSILNEL